MLFYLKTRWVYMKANKCYGTVEYLNHQDPEKKIMIFNFISLFIHDEVPLLWRWLNKPIYIIEDFCFLKNMYLGHTWNFLICIKQESLLLMEPILGNISARHAASSQAESLCYPAVTPLICQMFCNPRLTFLKYRKQSLYLKENAKLESPLSTRCLNTKYKMSWARWQSPQSTCEISQGGDVSPGSWVPLTKAAREQRTGTDRQLWHVVTQGSSTASPKTQKTSVH